MMTRSAKEIITSAIKSNNLLVAKYHRKWLRDAVVQSGAENIDISSMQKKQNAVMAILNGGDGVPS